jgi:nucleotide-binding universal stress UspA family protein
MKILVVADDKPYSRPAVDEAVKLALNTWADVTLLGLLPKGNGAQKPAVNFHRQLQAGGPPLGEALEKYKNAFLQQGQDGKHPYSQRYETDEWIEVRPDVWQVLRVVRGSVRDVRVRVRLGGARQVLAEEAEEEYDLIIIGGDSHGENAIGRGTNDLQKVIFNASCSVLVVKDTPDIKRIVCCLDQGDVTQESLELINQLVTIHGAALELLGVTRGEGWIKLPVDSKLADLWTYYHDRLKKQVYSGFKPLGELEQFVTQDARPDLLALWHGKTSVLKNVFSKGWLAEFIDKSRSSILLLR